MRSPAKRKSLTVLAAGVLAMALAGPVSASSQGSHLDDTDSAELRAAVTTNGILTHMRQLQRIAVQNDGHRASGTAGYDASVDYVVDTLREAGYNVRTQSFTFPFFAELEPTELYQTAPEARELETEIFQYSGSGDVTGAVIPATNNVVPADPEPSSAAGCAPGDFADPGEGPAIALVQRGTCDFAVKVDNAVDAGYDAVIIFNEGNPGREDLEVGTLTDPKDVPVVGLSYPDAVELTEAAEDGKAEVRIVTSVEVDPERETVNVFADSPGVGTNDHVVVGAHLDSVVGAAGINDNASGSAAVLEIAVQMAELELTDGLERPVRFAFWGAEESGLLGARHYVDTLTNAQLARTYAYLNFDMVASPNFVRFVYDGDGSDTPIAGPPGSDVIESLFVDYFEDQGLASDPTDLSGRSDYAPFAEIGVPVGGLFTGAEGVKTQQEAQTYGGTAGEAYDPCYHTVCDDMTNVSVRALGEMTDAAAHAVLTLATSSAGLYPDASRSPMSAPDIEFEQNGSHPQR